MTWVSFNVISCGRIYYISEWLRVICWFPYGVSVSCCWWQQVRCFLWVLESSESSVFPTCSPRSWGADACGFAKCPALRSSSQSSVHYERKMSLDGDAGRSCCLTWSECPCCSAFLSAGRGIQVICWRSSFSGGDCRCDSFLAYLRCCDRGEVAPWLLIWEKSLFLAHLVKY